MSELEHAESFRDLLVYKKARQLSREIFALTKTFPKDETYSLIDQIRRSSRSVGATLPKPGPNDVMKSILSVSSLTLMANSKKPNTGLALPSILATSPKARAGNW